MVEGREVLPVVVPAVDNTDELVPRGTHVVLQLVEHRLIETERLLNTTGFSLDRRNGVVKTVVPHESTLGKLLRHALVNELLVQPAILAVRVQLATHALSQQAAGCEDVAHELACQLPSASGLPALCLVGTVHHVETTLNKVACTGDGSEARGVPGGELAHERGGRRHGANDRACRRRLERGRQSLIELHDVEVGAVVAEVGAGEPEEAAVEGAVFLGYERHEATIVVHLVESLPHGATTVHLAHEVAIVYRTQAGRVAPPPLVLGSFEPLLNGVEGKAEVTGRYLGSSAVTIETKGRPGRVRWCATTECCVVVAWVVWRGVIAGTCVVAHVVTFLRQHGDIILELWQSQVALKRTIASALQHDVVELFRQRVGEGVSFLLGEACALDYIVHDGTGFGIGVARRQEAAGIAGFKLRVHGLKVVFQQFDAALVFSHTRAVRDSA